MKSKAKFLPLVVFAAILVSLVFIIPVFSATGTVRFAVTGDEATTQTFARQGGNITLEVTDSDLNLAIKRVLLPTLDMTQNGATAAVTAASSIITFTTSTNTLSETATTTASLVSPGDTILIGNDTVRLVVSVVASTSVVTVNKGFTTTDGTATVNKVTQALGLAAVCPSCAAAEAITIVSPGATFFGLGSVPMADTGSAGSPMNLANRFTTNADTVTNTNDLFLSDTNGNSVSATTTVTFVTGSTGLINVTNLERELQRIRPLLWRRQQRHRLRGQSNVSVGPHGNYGRPSRNWTHNRYLPPEYTGDLFGVRRHRQST